jgi:hypothetical protein
MKTFKSVGPIIFTLVLNIAFHIGMADLGELFWHIFGGVILAGSFLGTLYLGISEISLRRKREANKYKGRR